MAHVPMETKKCHISSWQAEIPEEPESVLQISISNLSPKTEDRGQA